MHQGIVLFSYACWTKKKLFDLTSIIHCVARASSLSSFCQASARIPLQGKDSEASDVTEVSEDCRHDSNGNFVLSIVPSAVYSGEGTHFVCGHSLKITFVVTCENPEVRRCID